MYLTREIFLAEHFQLPKMPYKSPVKQKVTVAILAPRILKGDRIFVE